MRDFSEFHDRSLLPGGDAYLAVHENRVVGSFMSGGKSEYDGNAERRRVACDDLPGVSSRSARNMALFFAG